MTLLRSQRKEMTMKKYSTTERPVGYGKCYDCDLPYSDFPIDLGVSDEIWELISPTERGGGGLLCPACMVKRLSELIPKEQTGGAKTVEEIVIEYLEANGFDGLYEPSESCACDMADLIACQDYCSGCVAGYKHLCPTDCGDPDHEFHISAEKPKGDSDARQ